MRVAFQGETGAFSEEAVRTYFGDGVQPVPRPTFEGVFEAVSKGDVDRGVIPIENSLFGSVHANYDLLQSNDLRIIGELTLRIRHYLMAIPGATIKGIRQVFSHPQALGQSQSFLKKNLPRAEIIPAYDTAGAAKMVAETGDLTWAAVASERAAVVYGLSVLAAGIESNHQNYTRFLVLSREEEPIRPGVPYKTSLVYAMRENVPGILFKSLAVFALRDINLFKIESRPLIGRPGEYLFYVDVAGSTEDPTLSRALSHLSELAATVKVLGTYPKGSVVGG
ncbi:MAG TPA: prephenate dehydratase [Rhodothermales bacterium]|nr:prephenate dehydratase [Rhodothermales bacterium]